MTHSSSNLRVVLRMGRDEQDYTTGPQTPSRHDFQHQDHLSGSTTPSVLIPPIQDIPNELWCDIWQYLVLRDRFSVAQVCSKWRAIAFSTPSLWTRLDYYVTRHHEYCSCMECCPDRNGDRSSGDGDGWVDSPYPRNSSNERLIGAVLGRSGALKLHLTLHCIPYACNSLAMTALAITLKGHSDRIAHISAVAPNALPVSQLLSHFQCLPALRSLSLVDAPGCWDSFVGRRIVGISFAVRPIELPSLVVLDLRGMAPLAAPHFNLTLPALRSLGLHTRRMCDVVRTLAACPRVALLHVKIAELPSDPYYDTSVDEVREALASVPTCRVEGIRPTDEDWLLDAFATAGHRSLVLRYLEFPARGFGILRTQERCPLRLEVAPDGMVSVSAVTSTRNRQLVFPANTADGSEHDEFWSVWEEREHAEVDVWQLRSDDATWTAFVEARTLTL